MGKTFCACLAAIDGWNLVALAELLARQDHPVGKLVHRPCVEARPIHTRLECNPLQTDLLCLFQYSKTVIFRHKLFVPVVHFFSCGETDKLQRSQSLQTLGFNYSCSSMNGRSMTAR